MPFTRPTAPPTSIAPSTTTGTGQPSALNMPSDRNVVSAKFEPTLRSMPPASMTSVIPSTTNISSPS